MKGLTAKQARFIREYLVDHNGAQAAIRAGYSKKYARQAAYRLLTKDYIFSEIERETADHAARLGLRCEDVIKNLLRAVNEAKEKGDAGLVISGWREIAKLLNLSPMRRKQVRESPRGSDYQAMTDSELLTIIHPMS